MSDVIHTCHGILSHQGRDSTDYLASMLAPEFPVFECSYPDLHSWQMRDENLLTQNAKLLIKQSADGDNVVAHSYGAMVVAEAMRLGRVFNNIFMFGPALDRDVYFAPDKYGFCYVIFNPRDKALLIASWLPFHPAGGLGRWGYAGESDRVINIRVPSDHTGSFLSHSDPFHQANIGFWVRFIRGVIRPHEG